MGAIRLQLAAGVYCFAGKPATAGKPAIRALRNLNGSSQELSRLALERSGIVAVDRARN